MYLLSVIKENLTKIQKYDIITFGTFKGDNNAMDSKHIVA
jgi:uncharacterized protein (DUF302 family)